MPIVLIVEDEWLLRASLAVEMERAGWRVLEATSGEEALDILSGGQHIDLLVTDIKLGGPTSGWDVAESFRELGAEPVVYASASKADPERQVAHSAFVAKPYAPADILEGARGL